MQTERLFKIIYYLLNQKTVTAKKLAEHIGVSRRTILRDIDTLSLSGIPIYTSSGNGGGIGLLDEFVLNKSILSEHEQNEILSALHGLSTVKTEKTQQVLQKLGALFNKSAPDWFEVDFSSWGNGSGHIFPNIKTAIFENRIVEFDYYNSYGEKRHRRVEPIQLWFKSKAWYLKGFCLAKQDIRLYKLSRIRNLSVTDELFSERILSSSFVEDLADAAEEKFRKYVTLVMKIDPEMVYRIYDYYGEEQIIKNDDGSCTVTITEPEDNGLYGFILSLGEYAEVLEPEHIRAIINEKALMITKKYLK